MLNRKNIYMGLIILVISFGVLNILWGLIFLFVMGDIMETTEILLVIYMIMFGASLIATAVMNRNEVEKRMNIITQIINTSNQMEEMQKRKTIKESE